MRRAYFIIALALLVVKAYAIHDLLINGSSAPTVTTADTLHINASFETSGAIANGVLYYDINENGQLDPTDPWLYKLRLIDGNFDDEDETPNGVYYEKREPLTCIGKFIFYAKDNGVSDTVLLTVNPLISQYCVYGRVTDPVNQANIIVCLLEPFSTLSEYKLEYRYGDFTDSTGSYYIPVPAEYTNKWWNMIAIDVAAVAPWYTSNDFVDDTVLIVDSVMKDIAMRPFLDTTTIYGVWKDDLGNPITESAAIFGLGYTVGLHPWEKRGETNDSGRYRIQLPRAEATFAWFYIICPGITTQFYPELMNPVPKAMSGSGTSPFQININLKAYRTTNTISGHVWKEGVSYDKCQLEVEDTVTSIGNTYTKTYLDGHYEMPVSDAASEYVIKVAQKSIPHGYEAQPPETTAAPGDTGVNFNVVFVGAEEFPKLQQKTSILVYPNPFIWRTVISCWGLEVSPGKVAADFSLRIYDAAGRVIRTIPIPDTQSPITKVIWNGKDNKGRIKRSGIYFYSLKAGDEVFKGKVIKLQ